MIYKPLEDVCFKVRFTVLEIDFSLFLTTTLKYLEKSAEMRLIWTRIGFITQFGC